TASGGEQFVTHRIVYHSNFGAAFDTTGFPFKAKQYATTYINIVGKLFNECADFRRTGSAALDLAYVAAGRV
ncbi:hypothetical protein ACUODJ_61410, partial [Escherichia sp. HC-CC]